MGTGQYDYNVYQTLLRIETLLNSMFEFFEPWNQFFSDIASYVKRVYDLIGGIVAGWLPMIVSGLLLISVILIVKWLVKL